MMASKTSDTSVWEEELSHYVGSWSFKVIFRNKDYKPSFSLNKHFTKLSGMVSKKKIN